MWPTRNFHDFGRSAALLFGKNCDTEVSSDNHKCIYTMGPASDWAAKIRTWSTGAFIGFWGYFEDFIAFGG